MIYRGTCPCCKKDFKFGQQSCDHFWPKSFGGKLHTSNMWRICRKCNTHKNNRMPNSIETVRFGIRKGFCSL